MKNTEALRQEIKSGCSVGEECGLTNEEVELVVGGIAFEGFTCRGAYDRVYVCPRFASRDSEFRTEGPCASISDSNRVGRLAVLVEVPSETE